VNTTPTADRLPRAARRPAQWPLPALIVIFLISRIGYYAAGVRFDASPLSWFFQYIDPELLRTHFWQSLWYLHSQPPMFNLFLGTALNLFPGYETAVFALCYLVFGLAFTVTLFRLLRGFGVSDIVSGAATAVYVASPACVLYGRGEEAFGLLEPEQHRELGIRHW